MDNDYEVRSWLVAFFGWQTKAVQGLNQHEVHAWRKHYQGLRQAGFVPAAFMNQGPHGGLVSVKADRRAQR